MKNEIQTPSYKVLFEQYKEFISAKGFKAGKTKVFETPVQEFLLWLEAKGATVIRDITTADMMAYYRYLTERPNQRRSGTLADSTIKTHLLALSFFVENLLLNRDLERAFHIPKHGSGSNEARSYLSVDEVKILYQNTANLLEDALLSIAYGCGLRRSEMEQLNTNDIQLSNGMLVVRKGKGDKRREVPMSDTVLVSIRNYIMEYRYQNLTANASQPAFFVNERGKRMSGERLNNILKKIIERTGNQTIIGKEISLHSLRHSIAHHLMENNATLDFIRGFLGHSYINTSYIYALKNKKRYKATKQHRLLFYTDHE